MIFDGKNKSCTKNLEEIGACVCIFMCLFITLLGPETCILWLSSAINEGVNR